MKKRRFVIGDIHGAHKAMLQCFERSEFDYEKDELICLGDVADGWPEVPECFEELRKVNNYVYIMGNHDNWLRMWFKFGETPRIWVTQGGQETLDAYERYKPRDIDRVHLKILEEARDFYVDEENNLFVHGGFLHRFPIENQDPYELWWDRHLWVTANYWQKQHDKGLALDKVKDYKTVFIGHTTTSQFKPDLKPVKASNVWNLDQGAGWEGKLTIMNIDTEEYWQSDIVADLYPDVKGRR